MGASTAQLFRVAGPLAEPEQLTDASDPVRDASYEPRDGHYVVFARASGGDEADKLYRLDLPGKQVTLLTDTPERHSIEGWLRHSSRLLTMYAGQVVEDSPLDDALVTPRHPYTAGLLAAMPHRQQGRRRLTAIPGRVPSGASMPAGCRFAPRCAFAVSACEHRPIELETTGPESSARCLRAHELQLQGVTQ